MNVIMKYLINFFQIRYISSTNEIICFYIIKIITGNNTSNIKNEKISNYLVEKVMNLNCYNVYVCDKGKNCEILYENNICKIHYIDDNNYNHLISVNVDIDINKDNAICDYIV